MDCIVHGVTKSWTLLSNFHRYTLFFFKFLAFNIIDLENHCMFQSFISFISD